MFENPADVPMFKNPAAWIRHVDHLTRTRDLDNLVLFAGDPGLGKSTLMLQIAKALDPTFSIDKIHFKVNDFLADARASPPFSCVMADELLLNRRKSMSKENIEFGEFLQVGRALNLHMLLAFPHAGMLDRQILDRRVRYRVDIPSQGTALLSERRFRTVRDVSGHEDYVVTWVPMSPPWRFAKNSGVFWEEYLAKKLSAARQREADARGQSVTEMDTEDAPRVGNTKIRLPRKGGHLPKFLSREGRHPKGCGKTFPCPTDVHL